MPGPIPSSPSYVYRGVHAEHPALEAARQGIVIPGKIDGTVTPSEHNEGNNSGDSPYTSWSYSEDVANEHATNFGRGYVILRIDLASESYEESLNWEISPDLYGEDEVLLRGVRINVEVLHGG